MDLVRVLLLIAAMITFILVCNGVRHKKMMISDSFFWIFCTLALIIVGIFPQLLDWLASLTGFMSPSNLLFSIIIGVMFLKMFKDACKISLLNTRVNELAQEVALNKHNCENKH